MARSRRDREEMATEVDGRRDDTAPFERMRRTAYEDEEQTKKELAACAACAGCRFQDAEGGSHPSQKNHTCICTREAMGFSFAEVVALTNGHYKFLPSHYRFIR